MLSHFQALSSRVQHPIYHFESLILCLLHLIYVYFACSNSL